MDYAATIHKLAADIGATVYEDQIGERDAYSTLNNETNAPELHVQPLKNDDAYWVALHELGHLTLHHVEEKETWTRSHLSEVDPWDALMGIDPYPRRLLQVEEAAATEWALAHGGGTPAPKAAAFLQTALESYNDDSPSGGGHVDHPEASYCATLAKLKGYAKGEVYKV